MSPNRFESSTSVSSSVREFSRTNSFTDSRLTSESEDEDLDPRVQEELDKLNDWSNKINELELQLEEATHIFRTLLSDSTQQLKATADRLGKCIEKSRPYFDALDAAKQAQRECQSAATNFQRASSIYDAAKETVALAEERFHSTEDDSNNGSNSVTDDGDDAESRLDFDSAWQEMLNHATIKVMQAETQKTVSEAEHSVKALKFQEAERKVHKLCKKLAKYTDRALPYFEQKTLFNRALEAQKAEVIRLQEKIAEAKREYSNSLHNLEDISESIHARRRIRKDMRRFMEQQLRQHSRDDAEDEAQRAAKTIAEATFDLDDVVDHEDMGSDVKSLTCSTTSTLSRTTSADGDGLLASSSMPPVVSGGAIEIEMADVDIRLKSASLKSVTSSGVVSCNSAEL